MNWRVPPTLTSSGCFCIEDFPEKINNNEICKISSFPLDFNFLNQKVHYICGMSVPPLMIAKIAERVYNQWLKKIHEVEKEVYNEMFL